MIIKFSSKIELNGWHQNSSYMDPIYVRKLIPYEDYDEVIVISVRRHIASIDKCYANFYSPLSFLHNYFPPNLKEPFYIEGNLDFAKNYVDNFLIRMSGLRAFL